jgi:hypothetical protein
MIPYCKTKQNTTTTTFVFCSWRTPPDDSHFCLHVQSPFSFPAIDCGLIGYTDRKETYHNGYSHPHQPKLEYNEKILPDVTDHPTHTPEGKDNPIKE